MMLARLRLLVVLALACSSSGCVTVVTWDALHYPQAHFSSPMRAWVAQTDPDGATNARRALFVVMDQGCVERAPNYFTKAPDELRLTGPWLAKYELRCNGALSIESYERREHVDSAPSKSTRAWFVDEAEVEVDGARYRFELEEGRSEVSRATAVVLMPFTAAIDLALSPLYLIGFAILIALL